MYYSVIPPSSKLAGLVRFYWILEAGVSQSVPYVHRTLANPFPELLFHYHGIFRELDAQNRSEASFLTGIHAQTDRVRRFVTHSDFGIFGVCLQPYAVPILIHKPSEEVSNTLPDLFALFGQEGKDLSERMIVAADTTTRVRIINRFLEGRLRESARPEIIHATQRIFRERGLTDVKALAETVSLSQRQFERQFKANVGFSPKSFSRIVRFNSLLSDYAHNDVSLTEMAYDFGYYDQSHFIHDFKKFSGYSPKTYFSGKAEEVFYSP